MLLKCNINRQFLFIFLYVILLQQVSEIQTNFVGKRMSGEMNKKIDAESERETQEIGTILFEDNGFTKRCFNQEDMALLATRLKFQSLIPTKSSSLENDESIETKIRFFYGINDVISRMRHQQTKELINKAFYDMLGGYLKHFLLPVTKYSFYAGNVTFSTANNLFNLYEKCKNLLNTNGNSWKEPMTDFSSFSFNIEKIQISKSEDDEEEMKSCVNLMLNKDDLDNDESMLVPLPKMEVEESEDLSTIWLPFKRKHIFNINSKNSAFVLLKYFVQVSKCYNYQGASQSIFNHKLKTWILESVVPYLDDEKLYPAFGAVLRILESIKQPSDSGYVGVREMSHQSVKSLFSKSMEHQENPGFMGRLGMLRKKNQENEDYLDDPETDYEDVRNYINLGIIGVGSFVFLLVLIFCLLRIVKNRSRIKKKNYTGAFDRPVKPPPSSSSESSQKSCIKDKLRRVFIRNTHIPSGDEDDYYKKDQYKGSSDEFFRPKTKLVTWENEKNQSSSNSLKKKSSEKLKKSSSGIMKKSSDKNLKFPLPDSGTESDEDVLLKKIDYPSKSKINLKSYNYTQNPHYLYKISEEDSETSNKSPQKKSSTSQKLPESQKSSNIFTKLRKRSKSPKKDEKSSTS